MMTHKAMNDPTPLVSRIEVLTQGPTGVTALVDGRRQTFPNLDALFRTAVRLLDGKPGSSTHAVQRELLPMERNLS
jgi:hypothetical protein